eukprot:7588749-Karenia_brevis.AAC.1
MSQNPPTWRQTTIGATESTATVTQAKEWRKGKATASYARGAKEGELQKKNAETRKLQQNVPENWKEEEN